MSEEYKPINNLWKDSEGYRYFGTLKLSSKIKYNGGDFTPLWEWVKQLQQENQQLKIQISAREKEYRKLEDNWNKLKEFLETNWKETQDIWFIKILNKMQELERGVNK